MQQPIASMSKVTLLLLGLALCIACAHTLTLGGVVSVEQETILHEMYYQNYYVEVDASSGKTTRIAELLLGFHTRVEVFLGAYNPSTKTVYTVGKSEFEGTRLDTWDTLGRSTALSNVTFPSTTFSLQFHGQDLYALLTADNGATIKCVQVDANAGTIDRTVATLALEKGWTLDADETNGFSFDIDSGSGMAALFARKKQGKAASTQFSWVFSIKDITISTTADNVNASSHLDSLSMAAGASLHATFQGTARLTTASETFCVSLPSPNSTDLVKTSQALPATGEKWKTDASVSDMSDPEAPVFYYVTGGTDMWIVKCAGSNSTIDSVTFAPGQVGGGQVVSLFLTQ